MHTRSHTHMGAEDCVGRARAFQDSEGDRERERAWAQAGGEGAGETLRHLQRSDSLEVPAQLTGCISRPLTGEVASLLCFL